MKRATGIFATFLLAIVILAFSILNSQPSYVFSQDPSPSPVSLNQNIDIKYELAYPGPVSPDSPFWLLKALRDRVWVIFSFDDLKKADVLLTIADKRLAQAVNLFKAGKYDLGASVLTKSEKYLEEAKASERSARGKGKDTGDFLSKFAQACLKHRQVIETEITTNAPEDAKPMIVKTEDYSKKLFLEAKGNLSEMGRVAPENPFDSF